MKPSVGETVASVCDFQLVNLSLLTGYTVALHISSTTTFINVSTSRNKKLPGSFCQLNRIKYALSSHTLLNYFQALSPGFIFIALKLSLVLNLYFKKAAQFEHNTYKQRVKCTIIYFIQIYCFINIIDVITSIKSMESKERIY